MQARFSSNELAKDQKTYAGAHENIRWVTINWKWTNFIHRSLWPLEPDQHLVVSLKSWYNYKLH